MRARWSPVRVPALALLLLAGVTASRAEGVELFLTIDSITLAAPPRGEQRLGFIAGRALAHSGNLQLFDVVFLLDVSGSTAESSGADIDGDGSVARGPNLGGVSLPGGVALGGRGAGGDSILAAEVAAVQALLDTFDTRTTRVGVVTFSGTQHRSADHAWVEVPLTTDYRRVHAALEGVLAAGPRAGTNMYAGLRLAGIELRGGRSAESTPRSSAQRYIVLLTDGFPTLPDSSRWGTRRSREAEDRAIDMARQLRKKDIVVHTFAIGREATGRPRAAVEVARESGGRFTPVHDPGELGRLLSKVQFAAIEELRIRNLSNGLGSVHQLHNADGGYAGLVPVQEGVNTIEVLARATDGSFKRVETTTIIAPGPLTARQHVDRVRLLEISRAHERRKPEPEREIEIGVEDDEIGVEDDEIGVEDE